MNKHNVLLSPSNQNPTPHTPDGSGTKPLSHDNVSDS